LFDKSTQKDSENEMTLQGCEMPCGVDGVWWERMWVGLNICI